MSSNFSVIRDPRYSISIEKDDNEIFVKFTAVPNSYVLKSAINIILLMILNFSAMKICNGFELPYYKIFTLRFLIFLATLMLLRKPAIESMTVIRNYGVQVTRVKGLAICPNTWVQSWIEHSDFLARDVIVDIIINEGFVRNQQVIFYLAILAREAKKLTLLFPTIRLRLKEQRIIYNMARNCLFGRSPMNNDHVKSSSLNHEKGLGSWWIGFYKMGKKLKKPNLKATLQRHQNAARLRKIEVRKKVVKNQKNNRSEKKTQSPFIPFDSESTLLLVGEGDFSFARSIIEQNYIMPDNLVITSYDNSPEELVSKYPHSFQENYEFLISERVPIFFGIDATDLVKSFHLSKKTTWTKILGESWNDKCLENIMFNFPHTGKGIKDQQRNIRDHQNLILGVFRSCREFFHLINSKWSNAHGNAAKLSEEGWGKVILTIFSGEPYDSWTIKKLAKDNNLQLQRSNRFQWENFPGYHHRRTNSEQATSKPAEEREARVFIFEKSGTLQSPKKRRKRNDSDTDDTDDDH